MKKIVDFLKKRLLLFLLLYLILRLVKMEIFLFKIDAFVLTDGLKSIFNQILFSSIFFLFTSYLILFIFLRFRWGLLFYFIFEYFYLLVYFHYYGYFKNYFFLTPQFHNFIEGLQALSTIKFDVYIGAFFLSLIDFLPVILLLNKELYFLFKNEFYKINGKIFVGFILSILLLFVRELYQLKKSKSIFNYVANVSTVHKRNTQEMVRKYGTTITAFSTIFVGFKEENIIKELINYGPEKVFKEKNKKYNLILIQVESLESGVIFANHRGKQIMPFLFSLKTNGWFCKYVVAYHGIGATTDADFSIINSIEASDKVPLFNLKTYNFPQSVAHILNSNNFLTVAFHNNDGSYFDRKTTLRKMGFQKFYDLNEMGLKRKWWGAPDKEMFEFIKSKIMNEKKPFFYYVITMSSHGPFDHVLKEYGYTNKNIIDILSKNDSLGFYWNAMSYVDEALSNFVDFVLKNFEDTHIIIIGDHTPNLSNSSIVLVNNERIEIVPFFFIPAKNSTYMGNEEIKYFMSQLDVLPTIIDVVGASGVLRTYGDSIFSIEKDYIPYRNLRLDRKKLLEKLSF